MCAGDDWVSDWLKVKGARQKNKLELFEVCLCCA